jgi:hypothetical protein
MHGTSAVAQVQIEVPDRCSSIVWAAKPVEFTCFTAWARVIRGSS